MNTIETEFHIFLLSRRYVHRTESFLMISRFGYPLFEQQILSFLHKAIRATHKHLASGKVRNALNVRQS
ncbi:Uncharacterised protein [Vibrio cholerae]|uniref:Uncharacterized protein n=1 Tax=Vibrio cholerae TaxID=666 RepID=A0A655R849_VIBCL|nr:Uncharacterised protein [Vibrio cholerae]